MLIAHPIDQFVQLVFVNNQQVTSRTVAAGFVNAQWLRWLNANEQRLLPKLCRSIAFGAAGEARIRVRIEKEFILWLLLAKPFFAHWRFPCRYRLYLGYKLRR